MKSTMRSLSFFFILILFSGCTKKSLPYFQNTTHPNLIIKNCNLSLENVPDNTVEQMDAQNQSVASVSPNDFFTKEDLVKENVGLKVQEKATFQPKNQRIEKVKSRQMAKIKKAHFEEKPKYEKISNAAGIFGSFALALVIITIALAFTSEYVLFFWVPTLIFANIALILGAVSVKKVVKKQKARFGIMVGLVWDVLLLSFIGWLVFLR